jgi:hypothetical protein
MKPTLEIKDIAPNLRFVVGTTSSDSVRYMRERMANRELVIDFDVFLPTIGKNLQRGYVWTALQKSEYLLSIFKNYGSSNGISDMQSICIVRREHFANNGVQKWEVIDGKQRLSTILDFVAGKVCFEWNGVEYYYNDLDEVMQGVINRFWFNTTYAVTRENEPITDLQKIDWFRSVNFLGTPQDKEHLNNILQ